MDGQEKAPASNTPLDANPERVQSGGHNKFTLDPTVPPLVLQPRNPLEIVLILLRIIEGDKFSTHHDKNVKLQLVMEFVEDQIPPSHRNRGVDVDYIPF